jgi:thiol-disulfide isomerase/thioredoxin
MRGTQMNKRVGKLLLTSIGLSLILATFSSPGANATTHSKATKPKSTVYAFNGKTLAGASFSGKSLAGKPVILWFWAPWCSICRGEAPDISALAKSFSGKVKIVGVAGLGSVSDMKQFVADTHTSGITHLADTNGSIWLRFQIPAQPSFVFVTSKGTAYQQIGGLSKVELYTLTKQLLSKSV